MFIIEEDGYSYLVFNIKMEVFNKFKEDLSKESFSEIIGIETFKIPKNDKISTVYYIECTNSKYGRVWIEDYWINKVKLNCPNLKNSNTSY